MAVACYSPLKQLSRLGEQQKGILSEEDLLKIGHERIRREEQALKSANGYLFCDTSPLTTLGNSI
jgi:HTH-type transcriptional repressor of NAD biosynthesis genes